MGILPSVARGVWGAGTPRGEAVEWGGGPQHPVGAREEDVRPQVVGGYGHTPVKMGREGGSEGGGLWVSYGRKFVLARRDPGRPKPARPEMCRMCKRVTPRITHRATPPPGVGPNATPGNPPLGAGGWAAPPG